MALLIIEAYTPGFPVPQTPVEACPSPNPILYSIKYNPNATRLPNFPCPCDPLCNGYCSPMEGFSQQASTSCPEVIKTDL